MLDLLKSEYVDIMLRALEHYKWKLKEDGDPEQDMENVEIMLALYPQLPELIKLFTGGK